MSIQALSGEIRVDASSCLLKLMIWCLSASGRILKGFFSIPVPLFLGHTVCAISVGVISFVSDAFIPAVQHPSRGLGTALGFPRADSGEEPW